MLGAVGVVYGDIGTSPLYTMREVFGGHHALAFTPENVYGLLSVIFWALVVVVTLKYVVLIMRADNRGEGGILALTALVSRGTEGQAQLRWWLVGLGIFGSAMFFGDAMITPAISVLSAVEGIEVITPLLHPFIVPLTLVILVGLFWIQKRGTGSVGALFGPICALWFVVLAVLGLTQIVQNPAVLLALSPHYAVVFVGDNPTAAFLALGAVVLAVTGTEALYADMGHFGASPIRRAWLLFVMPALVMNYFGQGALLLANPAAIKNPFYLLAPQWGLLPLVILATCATVIASQAVISGAFSLTRQAIQMGYCPRIKILHTSHQEIGQIYVPFINWTLLVAVILLVLGFRSSSNLAGAYGIAVTLAMLIDSVLIYFVMRRIWHWSRAVSLGIAVPLALIDFAFLASNSLKIPEGGWFPLLIGGVVFTLLTTWKRGRQVLMKRLAEDSMPLDLFIESIEASPPPRVAGTAVFMASHAGARAARAAAQPQAQQGAARARGVPDGAHARHPHRAAGGTGRDRRDRDHVLADPRELRIQGRPRRAVAARRLRSPRLQLRHDGHVVLRLARDADRDRHSGHGAVARAPVRVDVQERRQGDGLLPHPDQPRRRARYAGRALTRSPRRRAPRALPETTTPALRPASSVLPPSRLRTRRSPPSWSSWPCFRAGESAPRRCRTRRQAPAASPDSPRAASGPR